MPSRLPCTTVFLLAIASPWWVACQQNPAPKPVNPATVTKTHHSTPADQSVRGAFSTQHQLHFDSLAILRFLDKYPDFKPLQADLIQFYGPRHFAYAWFDKDGMIDQAENLYNQVMNMAEEGLPDKVPYKELLDSVFDVYDPTMEIASPERELMLTAQYFNYAQVAWGGISEEQTKSLNWFLPRKKIDLPSLLDSLLRDNSSNLMEHSYTTRQYGLLKDYLKKYRDLESKSAWTTLPTSRLPLRLGDTANQILAIKQRLYALGDLSQNDQRPAFDSALRLAVLGLQRRLGMKPDGVINSSTIEALNQPLQEVVLKIMLNLERCRWVPVSLNNDYLVVNIPAFQLWAMHQDSLVFSMNVVVGKALHKTVIFNGDLKTIVFSPYWNVPPDIMKKEILPALRKDPGYLKKQNMEWNGNSIRQLPGPRNALGEVKFLFPNQYHIYLHDSPAKSLFHETVRAFSHGCIRVAEPKKLAIYLLRGVPAWTEARIEAAMKSGKEQYVPLKNPQPVFIAYLTAWVDQAGKLNLRKDIYQRDGRLQAELFGQASAPNKSPSQGQ
jgi:L,D-transpeptidase YcbB